MWSRIFSKVSGWTASIAARFGAKTPGVIIAVVLSLCLVGYGAYYIFNLGELVETVWVGDICEPWKGSLEGESKKKGVGEHEVPEITSGSYKTGYGAVQWMEMSVLHEGVYGDGVNVAGVGFVKLLESAYGPCLRTYEKYGGKQDAYGYDKVGDVYFGAWSQWFAVASGHEKTEMGDLLTIYFDDGSSIEYCVCDHKANEPCKDPNSGITADGMASDSLVNHYGHVSSDGYVDLLEFAGNSGVNDAPGAGFPHLRASTGGHMTRVTSVTNHGMWDKWAAANGISGSMVGAANGALSETANRDPIAQRTAECLGLASGNSNEELDCECMECETTTDLQEMVDFAVSISVGASDSSYITQADVNEQMARAGQEFGAYYGSGLVIKDGGRLGANQSPRFTGSGRGYGLHGELDGWNKASDLAKFIKEDQEEWCSKGWGGVGTYGPVSCSPWIPSILRKFEFDTVIGKHPEMDSYTDMGLLAEGSGSTDLNAISATGEWIYMLSRPDLYELVSCGTALGSKARGVTNQGGGPIDQVCEPGDILAHGSPSGGHILMYVGNDAIRKKYPDSNANCIESGELSQYFISGSHYDTTNGYDVFRLKARNMSSCDDCEEKNAARQAPNDVVAAAMQYLDKPYHNTQEGDGPDDYCVRGDAETHVIEDCGGFTCSGLVWRAYHDCGYDIPKSQRIIWGENSQAYWVTVKNSATSTTDISKLQPGDLIFYGDPSNTGHVAMYIGNGQRIEATYGSAAEWHNPGGVRISPADGNIAYAGPVLPTSASRAATSSSGGDDENKCLDSKKFTGTSTDEYNGDYSSSDFSDLLLVGDSVANRLSSHASSLMPGSHWDSQAGTQVFEDNENGGNILDRLKSQASGYKRIVIETGYNDSALSMSDLNKLIEACGEDKDIWLCTMYQTNATDKMTATNSAMLSVAAQHKNVHIIDWYSTANGHPDWVEGGCHPVESAGGVNPCEIYAKLIKSVVCPRGGDEIAGNQ